jgi:hypothetical protein
MQWEPHDQATWTTVFTVILLIRLYMSALLLATHCNPPQPTSAAAAPGKKPVFSPNNPTPRRRLFLPDAVYQAVHERLMACEPHHSLHPLHLGTPTMKKRITVLTLILFIRLYMSALLLASRITPCTCIISVRPFAATCGKEKQKTEHVQPLWRGPHLDM